MDRKLIIAIIVVIIFAFGIYMGFKYYKPAPPINAPKDQSDLGGQISEPVANPAEKLPETNPFKEAKTNPFEEAKTNPFKDVYKNPFE